MKKIIIHYSLLFLLEFFHTNLVSLKAVVKAKHINVFPHTKFYNENNNIE